MNPFDILKLRNAKNQFEQNHPKFGPFLRAAYETGIQEGSVIEISVTPPDGTPIVTNLRVQASDLEMLQELMQLAMKKNKQKTDPDTEMPEETMWT